MDAEPPRERRRDRVAVVTGVAYLVALLVCPVAAFLLWIMAFGIHGPIRPWTAEAIPGWLVLAVPALLGMLLGWVTAERRARPSRAEALGPAIAIVLGIAAFLLADLAGLELLRGLGPIGLLVLYLYAPVALGRLLQYAVSQPSQRSPE